MESQDFEKWENAFQQAYDLAKTETGGKVYDAQNVKGLSDANPDQELSAAFFIPDIQKMIT